MRSIIGAHSNGPRRQRIHAPGDEIRGNEQCCGLVTRDVNAERFADQPQRIPAAKASAAPRAEARLCAFTPGLEQMTSGSRRMPG